jgi:N-acetylneuraminic acid mutarotase
MQRKLLFFVFLLLFSTFPAQTTDDDTRGISPTCDIVLSSWREGAKPPANHIEGATAVVNKKLYLFGGFRDSSLNVSTGVDVYNPATDQWETASNSRRPMPTGISHFTAAVDGKWVWIAGGFVGKHPGKPTNEVWKYDTEQDLWYAGPSLPEARAGGFFARVGRKLHYTGGLSFDRNTTHNDHWVLKLNKPNKGWKRQANLPVARNHGGSATIGSLFYTVGGQFNHDRDPKDVRHLYAFDTATNGWVERARLPKGRSHAETGTLLLKKRLVVVGGRANQNGEGQLYDVTEYNPAKNKWRELRPLPNDLIAPHAAYIKGKLIVTAGGTSWNTPNTKTYISDVSFVNCN